MKFVHTGDLHIGKIVNGFSMIEDQKYILRQIYEICLRERADALVLAGDIYDRAIPPAEAVMVLNDFLTDMVRAGIPVLMISGNHDSPGRIGFADAILEDKGIHIAGVYREEMKKVMLPDEYGTVTLEAGQEKSVNLVEFGKDGEAFVQRIALTPLHSMRRIRGKLGELMRPEIVEGADADDYIRAELTDETELIDPIGTLRSVYPNIMQIALLKNEKKEYADYTGRLEEREKSIPELFKDFYAMIRGEEPDEERMKVVEEAAKEAEERV